MPLLVPTALSTRDLSVTREANRVILATEDSSISRNGIIPSRVYDDACDVGYTLVSHITGRRVIVAQSHTEMRDGDILWWDYVPVRVLDHGSLTEDFILRVFND